MNLKKLFGFKLPVGPKALLDAIGLTDQQSSQSIVITVMVDASLDAGLMAYARAALRPQTTNISVVVKPYFAEVVDFAPASNAVLMLANNAPVTGKLMVQALREQIPAVVATLDSGKIQQLARDNYNELDTADIVSVFEDGASGLGVGAGAGAGAAADSAAGEGASAIAVAADPGVADDLYKRLFNELAVWMVKRLKDIKTSLSCGFAFVRDPFVDDVIIATSIQNTAIAAVFFLPGADMPLLTINQIKMFLQIGAAYGADISTQRLKELAILLAGGFGWRAIARRLVGLVPMFGWAMRGGVGFSATYAIGKATKAYFEAGGDMVEIAKSLVPKKRDTPKR